MIPTLYRGSVKDVLGPVELGAVPAVVFRYTDAYSVFDWGRMPDLLPQKGQALTVLAADWFERLERAETWVQLSKSHEALGLRKMSRFGSAFNELGEQLQRHGLRTHYLGLATNPDETLEVRSVADVREPRSHLAVRQVSVVKPATATILGRGLYDYHLTRNSPAPRLIPLEVVFRFSCPEGSSLLARTARDSSYLASLGFPDYKAEAGQHWDFPVLELFTKLETSDRPVPLSEALAVSGLTAQQLQEMLLKTGWVAGALKWMCAQAGLTLADGKLEWGLNERGEVFLVDAIGPDELRLLKGDVQLSKEFLRSYYRKTPWYEAVNRSKQHAQDKGAADWKKLVALGPTPLPPAYKEVAVQLYPALANQLTGRKWFPSAWPLDQVIESIGKLEKLEG